MMKIAHIADLHFRSLTRHDEYRAVFTDLFSKLAKQGVDVVWVGGDIFHTKTSGISPEFIELLTWFLTELSKICEVHMMLGNHDGNLMNLSRQDAITPIIEALKNPRVFLYKKSGVYQFASGWNWCVFSPFDVPGWGNVKPVVDQINIACFHGPVWGATTEADWVIEGDVTVDFFKDYDFVLLGDIHKTQYLGYREVYTTS